MPLAQNTPQLWALRLGLIGCLNKALKEKLDDILDSLKEVNQKLDKGG
ncbi:hypothetical protein INT82_10470 [Mannheimia haemolytica]|nr:hypothetical protein [Mannheimia haemolytica]